MCALKWCFKVFLIGASLQSVELISPGTSDDKNEDFTEVLWKLTSYALLNGVDNVQGRQRGTQGGYGLSYPQRYPFGNVPYPVPNRPPPAYGSLPGGYQQGGSATTSIMDVLQSIAHNDELHCVPKLLCELTSGTRTGSAGSGPSSLLPFNVNMDSLLGLFSAIGSGNPLFLFGRAALLGYSENSGGNSCNYAFPQCPRDPDQLVNYLNNYNGGFFRYFQGVPPRPAQQFQQQQFYQQQYFPQQQGFYNPVKYYAPQKRILSSGKTTATSSFPFERNRFESGIKFPVDDGRAFLNELPGFSQTFTNAGGNFYTNKSPKSLTFPDGTSGNGRFYVRAPKTLTFPYSNDGKLSYYPMKDQEVLDFQRPSPNHIASPLIFPTRTGTGELLLDSDQFDKPYDHQYFNNNLY